MSSQTAPADTVLHNANVLTFDGRRRVASSVAVHNGRISRVSSDDPLATSVGRGVALIDCQGATLVPGFIDAHCHLLAYASSLLAVDCGPLAVSTISDIKSAVRQRASITPQGQWVRATGYDELELRERRHPSRWDLDEAAPLHPVRLSHGSGHAVVLNSLALVFVGISASTEEPPGGVIERDVGTGQPSGVLLEMDGYLDGKIPPMSQDDLFRGVGLANSHLLSRGLTSVQDATASNSIDRWELFESIKSAGLLDARVTMMAGATHLSEFADRGMGFGHGDLELNLGPAKIMLTATAGALHPDVAELRALVCEAQQAGFPVAVHAVEAESVQAAAEAIAYARDRGGIGIGLRHRVEHCSECPPVAVDALVAAQALVVTQPGFLYHRGRRYLTGVAPERQPWLYPLKSLREAGLCVAAGSDAPATELNPLLDVWAAAARQTRDGAVLNASQNVSVEQALGAYTVAGAFAASQEADKGSIEVGKLADLVLLDRDPLRVALDEVRDIRVLKTLVGGRVVWEA